METLIELNLKKVKNGTELTLKHSAFNIPEAYESHNDGWNYALEGFAKSFA